MPETEREILQKLQGEINSCKELLHDAYLRMPDVNDGGFIAGALGKLDQADDCLDEAIYRIGGGDE